MKIAAIIAGITFIIFLAYVLSLDYDSEKEVPCTDFEGNEIMNHTCIESNDLNDALGILFFGLINSILIGAFIYLFLQGLEFILMLRRLNPSSLQNKSFDKGDEDGS